MYIYIYVRVIKPTQQSSPVTTGINRSVEFSGTFPFRFFMAENHGIPVVAHLSLAR